jgi:hypothetical protein
LITAGLGAEAPDVQEYATGEEYGLLVSVPPAEPDQPLVAERSGNFTDVVPASALALRVNEPAPAGRNQTVPAV